MRHDLRHVQKAPSSPLETDDFTATLFARGWAIGPGVVDLLSAKRETVARSMRPSRTPKNFRQGTIRSAPAVCTVLTMRARPDRDRQARPTVVIVVVSVPWSSRTSWTSQGIREGSTSPGMSFAPIYATWSPSTPRYESSRAFPFMRMVPHRTKTHLSACRYCSWSPVRFRRLHRRKRGGHVCVLHHVRHGSSPLCHNIVTTM